jgi:hypothetical protein
LRSEKHNLEATVAIFVLLVVLLMFGLIVKTTKRHYIAITKYAGHPQLQSDIKNGVIRMGMSEDRVRDAWGLPSRRTVRQLKKGTKTTLYFGNQRVNFDKGSVTGWSGPTALR